MKMRRAKKRNKKEGAVVAAVVLVVSARQAKRRVVRRNILARPVMEKRHRRIAHAAQNAAAPHANINLELLP